MKHQIRSKIFKHWIQKTPGDLFIGSKNSNLGYDSGIIEKLTIYSIALSRNMTLEEFRKSLGKRVFHGTPEVVRNRFEEMIDLGFDYFQIMFPYPLDYDQSTKFAQLVLPKLK